MNDQLQTALADILNKTAGAVSAGADFLQAQLPDVIRQLLLWKMVYSAMLCAAGVVLAAALIVAAVKLWAWARAAHEKAPEWDKDNLSFTVFMAAFVTGVPSICVVLLLLDFTWLKILVAPKIYLIEYAAGLVK